MQVIWSFTSFGVVRLYHLLNQFLRQSLVAHNGTKHAAHDTSVGIRVAAQSQYGLDLFGVEVIAFGFFNGCRLFEADESLCPGNFGMAHMFHSVDVGFFLHH